MCWSRINTLLIVINMVALIRCINCSPPQTLRRIVMPDSLVQAAIALRFDTPRTPMKTTSLLAIPAVVTCWLLVGCGKHAQQPPTPPTVSVVQPVAREVVEWDEYIGRLESPQTVEVRARVSGYLD